MTIDTSRTLSVTAAAAAREVDDAQAREAGSLGPAGPLDDDVSAPPGDAGGKADTDLHNSCPNVLFPT
jgi:hypothetical protein